MSLVTLPDRESSLEHVDGACFDTVMAAAASLWKLHHPGCASAFANAPVISSGTLALGLLASGPISCRVRKPLSAVQYDG
ncbi:hypothetical protein ABH37_19675 [Mycobacterium haemophilum]|uniref:Uncharacterized protein n=1 Tax=Mycobacterium haemophilum TaxID=29311 RepID=A0A0I9UP28_9MYCO|nr:hypothetical protein ABH39_19680 [Mycobacterium haemophilum]KLO34127.1 hypothetical protein ABH38_19800 [Mycobacterium haemophilum]KLO36288.1 hypothetical protein ABH37_19675 [Mycobacterium haemophilum]KLO44566.1 hypothetical protein ABH36_19470 [Mycobacterium haemophilum]